MLPDVTVGLSDRKASLENGSIVDIFHVVVSKSEIPES